MSAGSHSIDEIRKFFSGDRYATELSGIEIDYAERGHSIVSLVPGDRHKNAVGHLMGAVYFTMADFAFAVAENCGLEDDHVTVTQSASISFMRACKGGRIQAEAMMVKDGKSTCVYEVRITDEEERELARVLMDGFKTSKEP
ncbi:MAG: PaaI family thioesterase [Lachnospiraceae bacterium]|nr:PaaI family thioesterase [Lachnospiraceae bacterium]